MVPPRAEAAAGRSWPVRRQSGSVARLSAPAEVSPQNVPLTGAGAHAFIGLVRVWTLGEQERCGAHGGVASLSAVGCGEKQRCEARDAERPAELLNGGQGAGG